MRSETLKSIAIQDDWRWCHWETLPSSTDNHSTRFLSVDTMRSEDLTSLSVGARRPPIIPYGRTSMNTHCRDFGTWSFEISKWWTSLRMFSVAMSMTCMETMKRQRSSGVNSEKSPKSKIFTWAKPLNSARQWFTIWSHAQSGGVNDFCEFLLRNICYLLIDSFDLLG
jgi:hypothetical protein